MPDHVNPPPPEAIAIAFEVYPGVVTSCTAEVKGASIVAEDGRVLTGQRLVGHGAIASIMERQTRDEAGPYRGIVVQCDGYLEFEAIWDGDRLIDGDGFDVAGGGDDDD